MIRKAEAKDNPTIKELVREFIKASTYNAKFDLDKITANLDHCRKTQVFLVVEVDQKVVGGCCGQIVESFLSDELVYQDLFFYIQREHRLHTKSLLSELERVVKERGVKRIVMASFGDNERLDKFYKLLGYELLETHFVKECK